MGKNHIIKSFRISDNTFDKFVKASVETGLKTSELSRILFNRALSELTAIAVKEGWNNLSFSVQEMN